MPPDQATPEAFRLTRRQLLGKRRTTGGKGRCQSGARTAAKTYLSRFFGPQLADGNVAKAFVDFDANLLRTMAGAGC
jgi:hypothetical protein